MSIISLVTDNVILNKRKVMKMETEKKRSSWTEWAEVTENGICDAMYKTNFKKVRVKFTTDNIVAESCCCRGDTFNLSFGIRMAYRRCLVKAWEKKKSESKNADEIKKIDTYIAVIKMNIKEMIDSFD